MAPDAEHWELPFCETFSTITEAEIDLTMKMERKETGAEENLHRRHTRYRCTKVVH